MTRHFGLILAGRLGLALGTLIKTADFASMNGIGLDTEWLRASLPRTLPVNVHGANESS